MGTDNLRPSVKETRNSSSEHSTSIARGVLSRTKETIPCLHKYSVIGFDHTQKPCQLLRGEPTATRQRDRREPKFGQHSITLNMNMLRFAILIGEKEESVWAYSQN